MSGLISDLTKVANDILGVRDTIGAAIHKVYIVKRTWTSGEVGSGTPVESVSTVKPSPGLKNLDHDFKEMAAGAAQVGDIILYGVSKQNYPTRSMVAFDDLTIGVEKFYRIDGKLYSVVSVVEKYITWDIHVRRIRE